MHGYTNCIRSYTELRLIVKGKIGVYCYLDALYSPLKITSNISSHSIDTNLPPNVTSGGAAVS